MTPVPIAVVHHQSITVNRLDRIKRERVYELEEGRENGMSKGALG
jgi:hypothetical protein